MSISSRDKPDPEPNVLGAPLRLNSSTTSRTKAVEGNCILIGKCPLLMGFKATVICPISPILSLDGRYVGMDDGEGDGRSAGCFDFENFFCLTLS